MGRLPAPVARGGRVLIPSWWSALAYATLEDESSPACAVELGRAVLAAADGGASAQPAEPAPDLLVEALS